VELGKPLGVVVKSDESDGSESSVGTAFCAESPAAVHSAIANATTKGRSWSFG